MRISKMKKLKQNWEKNLEEISFNENFSLDNSKFIREDIANEIIFGKFFEKIQLNKNKNNINDSVNFFLIFYLKNNWYFSFKEVKNRRKIIGYESTNNKKKSQNSLIILKNKSYFDFELSLDVLISSNGTFGINFRFIDKNNYFSFLIDKNSGNKILAKMVNGNFIILKKISDGGISLNQWHTIKINVQLDKISILMYDSEISTKTDVENLLEFQDNTFSKGSIGIFISNIDNFYFDNFSVKSISCWSPWTPKEEIDIKNPNANIYQENFKGDFEEKYEIHSLQENETKDGPAIWGFNSLENNNYIRQESNVSDISPEKRSNFVLLKQKNFANGKYLVSFIPQEKNGIISIIFKYTKEINNNKTEIEFYSFELNNEKSKFSQNCFELKIFHKGNFRLLKSIPAKKIPGLNNNIKKTAYLPKLKNEVLISVVNDLITISVNHNSNKFVEIFTVKNQVISNGLVGFGTFRTSANFNYLSLDPPELELTKLDIDNYVKNDEKDFPILIPSAKRIFDAVSNSPNISKRLDSEENADMHIKTQIFELKSSLGNNYNSKKNDESNIDSKNDNDDSENDIKDKHEVGNNLLFDNKNLRKCYTNKSKKVRDTWCRYEFTNDFLIKKCEKNFCVTCCEKNIPESSKNLLHICKKLCFKASLSIETNDDYKSTCIDSENRDNINAYCENKMKIFSKESVRVCKLDMCNLCCIGMDKIKKKNYSPKNFQNCFSDCAYEYQPEELSEKNSEVFDAKKIKKNLIVDISDYYREESYKDIKLFDLKYHPEENEEDENNSDVYGLNKLLGYSSYDLVKSLD